MSAKIEYRMVRAGSEPHPEWGRFVASVKCVQCDVLVCVAQVDDWPPPDGIVTLRLGSDWPEPEILGELVVCPECGGATMNGPDESWPT